jgi:hypothetical protein
MHSNKKIQIYEGDPKHFNSINGVVSCALAKTQKQCMLNKNVINKKIKCLARTFDVVIKQLFTHIET